MESIVIGVDEAGRGPLFGDVYTGAVILPSGNFDTSLLKDSKKFTSKKKITEVYQYIREQCAFFSIDYSTHEEIDTFNILQATQKSMHKSVRNVIQQWVESFGDSFEPQFFERLFIHVDGNYFNDFNYFYMDHIYPIQHKTLVKGDSLCKAISAASILAKVSRDQYIETFLESHPDYDEKYKLSTNKGYGTKEHLNGIRQHGYSPYHRKSFKVKSI
jgi:ribonuclease HII